MQVADLPKFSVILPALIFSLSLILSNMLSHYIRSEVPSIEMCIIVLYTKEKNASNYNCKMLTVVRYISISEILTHEKLCVLKSIKHGMHFTGSIYCLFASLE